MQKRGVLNLSFGMIFSIIIIIAIIGVAVYAVTAFLNLGETAELSLFHQKFQEEVDDVWASAITNKVVEFDLPRKIDLVCFGDLRGNTWDPNYEGVLDDFKRYSSNFEKDNTNRFIYPTEEAGEFTYKKVEKIDLSELGSQFECFEVENRKISVRLEKGNFDSEVKIKRP